MAKKNVSSRQVSCATIGKQECWSKNQASHLRSFNKTYVFPAVAAAASTCSFRPGICNVWRTFFKLESPRPAEDDIRPWWQCCCGCSEEPILTSGNLWKARRRNSRCWKTRFSTGYHEVKEKRQTLQIPGRNEHVLAAAAAAKKT